MSNELNNGTSLNDLEKQEHFSLERLKSFIAKETIQDLENKYGPRPQSSFIELMNWGVKCFSSYLSNQDNINKFVHNRIVMDGQFLQFCDISNIKIECLQKDSIISWKTDNEYEKFFIQGAFLIKFEDLEFIQVAWYHKANSYEDEVSFFIILSESNYDKYLQLRNKYDSWVQARDRSNLHVKVIDGEDIPYTKDNTWDDLFLPDDVKKDLRSLVETFLASKDFYIQHKIPWKRGILLFGKPGCHAKGTPVLMYNGSWKNVEDVVVGDLLMGPDSKPREVLQLVRDNDELYKITPDKDKSFVVNKKHKLYLESEYDVRSLPTKLDITVENYLKLSKDEKQLYKLIKFNGAYENSNLKSDIKSVESIGNGDYFGFTVDKDHKYVMQDYWITNNCGKTSLIRTIMSVYNFKPVTVMADANSDSIKEAFSYAQEQSPSLLYFEDLDSMLERGIVDTSFFLNLMDGISTQNGLLVVATANDIKKLRTNITNRPSRFDRKFEIPLPTKDMAYVYLKRWFGKLISDNKCQDLAKYSEKYEFSYAYLKELYLSSMFEALSNNRKSPTTKDIDNALNCLVKDKNILNGRSINTDKYFNKS